MIAETVVTVGGGLACFAAALLLWGRDKRTHELRTYNSRRGGVNARCRRWQSISERTGVSSDGSGFWGGYTRRNRARWS